MKIYLSFVFVFLLISIAGLITTHAQTSRADSTKKANDKKKDAFSILVYTRTISNSKGDFRFDQNVAPNFKILKWLRMEVGIRHGEAAGNLDAYSHYKVEFQTKSFFNRTRLIMRLSDNIESYGVSNFSRTNYLGLAETKIPVSQRWEAIANIGYVVIYKQNHVNEDAPLFFGDSGQHGIYKFGIKYKMKKGALEAALGTYDVFNPYQLNQPFYQVGLDYDLWERGKLYSYYRYQYNQRE